MDPHRTPLDAAGHEALFAGLALALLWAVTRPYGVRSALALIRRRAAFFVPAAMATAALFAITAAGPGASGTWIHENPWGLSGTGAAPGMTPGAIRTGRWIALAAVALGLAGLVGLLDASRDGRRVDGRAFLRGMIDHGPTFALGKIALAAAVHAVSIAVAPRSAGAIVFLVPSLLLAPLPGMASQHPRRPLRALVGTVRFAARNVGTVGTLVTAQAALLLGLFFLLDRATDVSLMTALLPLGASTVSFNAFPYLLLRELAPWHAWSCTVLAAIGSTCFVAAHWLGVTRGYTPAGPEDPEGGPDAPETGH